MSNLCYTFYSSVMGEECSESEDEAYHNIYHRYHGASFSDHDRVLGIYEHAACGGGDTSDEGVSGGDAHIGAFDHGDDGKFFDRVDLSKHPESDRDFEKGDKEYP